MTRYLRTETISLDQLTPFPGNARRGRVDVIKESIEKNGQYRSLIVREVENGPLVVLAGNHTMTAIGELGGKQARCEIIECDDATARRVNLVDNRSNDLAKDDEEALASLLEGLDDYVGTGFSEEDVDSLLAKYEVEEIAPYAQPKVMGYNDDAEEREKRVLSHGGPESRTMASRGIRDIFLAMPVAEADELGRMIMKMREVWGSLSQADVILRAARVAVRSLDANGDPEGASEVPYADDSDD